MYSQDNLDLICLAQEVDTEISGEVMSELLMDIDWDTTNMFWDLADHYVAGSMDKKQGIDVALSILTGYHMDTIAKMILERAEDSEDFDDEDTW